MRRIIGMLLSVFFVATVAALLIGFFWYRSQLSAPEATGDTVRIVVEEGASLKTISAELEEQGLIKNARVFEISRRFSGGVSLKAGTYDVAKGLHASAVAELLESGDVATNQFTITPGRRVKQLIDDLVAQDLTGVEVAFEQVYGSRIESAAEWDGLEGMLAAETYTLDIGDGAAELIRQAVERTDTLLLEREAEFAKQGLSIQEALILASIVEREVAIDEDMQRVAGVFYNRLEIGMKLESDATFTYAADEVGELPTVDFESPYNTRLYAGLTPGPISTVGVAALDAVANPIITDDIFFVSGDDGTTYFSETLAEHEENVQKYCTTLCQ